MDKALNNNWDNVVMHTREYDSTAMPVEDLLKIMETGRELAGRKAIIKESGKEIEIISEQWVWGWENGIYTTVKGVRYKDNNPLGFSPIALNEIKLI